MAFVQGVKNFHNLWRISIFELRMLPGNLNQFEALLVLLHTVAPAQGFLLFGEEF